MKKTILIILLCLVIPVWCAAQDIIITKKKAGSSGAAYSETWTCSDADSPNCTLNWAEAAGDQDIVSGKIVMVTGGWDLNALISDSATNTVSQYVKADFTWGGGTYPSLLVRYVNSTSGFYQIEVNQYCDTTLYYCANLAAIGGCTAIGSSVDMGTCNAGDDIGVTVTGTGASTVWRVWLRPTANTPVSASEWDSGDSTPDASWTNDPATAADTGKKFGMSATQSTGSSVQFDNYYAGDLP